MSMKQMNSLTASLMVSCIDFAVTLPLVLVMLLLAEAVTHLVTSFEEVVAHLLELLLPKAAEGVLVRVSEEEESQLGKEGNMIYLQLSIPLSICQLLLDKVLITQTVHLPPSLMMLDVEQVITQGLKIQLQCSKLSRDLQPRTSTPRKLRPGHPLTPSVFQPRKHL